MYLHANAKLGLAARFALVQAVEAGCSIRDAARRFNVSPATAHRWWRRWLEAGVEARRTLSCLFDRSSRPHRSPRQLAPHVEEAICACRRATGWGPRLIAGATGFAHSTVWKVLRRTGISRPPRAIKEPPNRYEWPCPDSAADRPDRLRIVDVAPAVGFALEPELPPDRPAAEAHPVAADGRASVHAAGPRHRGRRHLVPTCAAHNYLNSPSPLPPNTDLRLWVCIRPDDRRSSAGIRPPAVNSDTRLSVE